MSVKKYMIAINIGLRARFLCFMVFTINQKQFPNETVTLHCEFLECNEGRVPTTSPEFCRSGKSAGRAYVFI